jgi:hypothetical protein
MFWTGRPIVISQLSGLPSAAVAVELVTNGLRALFPVLGSNSPLWD